MRREHRRQTWTPFAGRGVATTAWRRRPAAFSSWLGRAWGRGLHTARCGTCSGEVGAGTLLAAERVRAMTTRMSVPEASCRCGPPGSGVGLRGTAVSPAGPRWGHNGSGPGFRARAFHTPACPSGRSQSACYAPSRTMRLLKA